MKKIVMLLGLVAVLTAAAFAQTFDFTLVNKTGFTIYAVYVSPSDDDEWGEDVLGDEVLPNKKSVKIEFDEDYELLLLIFDVDKYDLRCEFEDGSTIDWFGLKLEEIVTLTLSIDSDGDPVATWE